MEKNYLLFLVSNTSLVIGALGNQYLNDYWGSKVFFEILMILSFIGLSIEYLSDWVIFRNEKKPEGKSFTPHNLLFFAAIFLPATIRETSLGDMEEIYKKDVNRFGVKKAKWLMFKDIVVSNYPIMKEFARKSAINFIKFAGVYEAVRRIIG
jgi:hypothetical protein